MGSGVANGIGPMPATGLVAGLAAGGATAIAVSRPPGIASGVVVGMAAAGMAVPEAAGIAAHRGRAGTMGREPLFEC